MWRRGFEGRRWERVKQMDSDGSGAVVLFLRFVDVTKIWGGWGVARFCRCGRFFFLSVIFWSIFFWRSSCQSVSVLTLVRTFAQTYRLCRLCGLRGETDPTIYTLSSGDKWSCWFTHWSRTYTCPKVFLFFYDCSVCSSFFVFQNHVPTWSVSWNSVEFLPPKPMDSSWIFWFFPSVFFFSFLTGVVLSVLTYDLSSWFVLPFPVILSRRTKWTTVLVSSLDGWGCDQGMVHHQGENGTQRLHTLYRVFLIWCGGAGGVLFLSSAERSISESVRPWPCVVPASSLSVSCSWTYKVRTRFSLSHGCDIHDMHWAVVIDRLVCDRVFLHAR